MAPPVPPPRNHRGQLVNAKGQPVDRFDRRLDGFDRPMTQRILRSTHDLPFDKFPNVLISYPHPLDWVAMFDPRNNRSLAANRQIFEDFKQRHQKQMGGFLKLIAGTAAGQAMLASASRVIRILPIDFVSTSDEWIKFHTNAIATADSAVQSVVKGMHATNLLDEVDEDTGDRTIGDNLKGDGTGSSARVFFTPGRNRPGGPGSNPDETLFHELVHATRDTQGASTVRFSMGMGWDNAEEFAAVVTTNVYMSEKKQTVLRAHHHGRAVLQHADRFLDSPLVPPPGARGLLVLMRRNQPDFFRALANIDRKTAAFNPFRDLDDETKRGNAAHETKMRSFDRRR